MLAVAAYDGTDGVVTAANTIPDTLPENGWIRVTNIHGGGNDVFYGYYSHRDPTRFFLGNNFRSSLNQLEDPTAVGNGAISSLTISGHIIQVWSKTGNLRWDNGFQRDTIALRPVGATNENSATNSAYDHLASTHVHFNGVTDAIDRTRAVGAVG